MAVTNSESLKSNGTFLGRRIARADGVAKVTGQADYALEHDLAGVVHAVIVESTVPSGRIGKIDLAAARTVPGVLRILTHADALPLKSCPMVPAGSVMESFLPLQDDRIRYNGQPIALVVADSFDHATEAAGRVRIDYETELAVADIDDPTARPIDVPGAPSSGVGRGDAKGALAAAAVRMEAVYTTPREYSCPMEPLGTIAAWGNDGGLTVWMPSQWAEGARRAFSDWFAIPMEKVRVISPFVGGGFGVKVSQLTRTPSSRRWLRAKCDDL